MKVVLIGSLDGKLCVGFENIYFLYDCNEEEVKKFLIGDEISFEVLLNKNFDVIKYVIMYVNILNFRWNILEDSLKVKVYIYLYDSGYFFLYDDKKDVYY